MDLRVKVMVRVRGSRRRGSLIQSDVILEKKREKKTSTL